MSHPSHAISPILLLLAIICVLGPARPAVALDVPAYKGYVNDYADMISQPAEVKLERALQSFDLTDSTQVAILTVPSLAGDSLEDFSIRVATQWQIGQRGKDNGVLLLVAEKERAVRIEVGRGLEPVLTDLLSGRIVDGVITPSFQAGRIDQGFEAGVAAIIQATRGEFKATRRADRGRSAEEPSPLFHFLFFGMFVVGLLGKIWRPLGVAAGSILFPLAFLFGLLPFSFLLLFLLIPAGAFGGWLLPLFMTGMLLRGGGGYYGGGFGGGGGGGFGGFGGGGFGGGGASGRW